MVRVVIWTFDCPPDDLKPLVCDHKNQLKDNNHLSNLEWVTLSENRINKRPYTMNQDREKHPEPDGWELHKYHDHHDFPNIAACAETGFIVVTKNNNRGIRPIAFHRVGNYWRVSGTTRKNERKTIAAHRMVWECVTGETLESDDIIDHISSNTNHNMMSNLKRSNPTDNARNCKKSKNNTSGVTGVSYREDCKRWVVKITDNERNRISKNFKFFEDAVLHRQNLEKKFGGYKIVSS